MRWPCKYNNILINKGVCVAGGGGGGLCPLETIDILETQFKWKPLQIIFLLNFGAEPDHFFTIFLGKAILFLNPLSRHFFSGISKARILCLSRRYM